MSRRKRTAAVVLVGTAAFLLGRLLPATGIGLWIRLTSVTSMLLAPGVVVAAKLELPLISGGVVWSLGCIGFGLAAAFVLHATLVLAIVVAAALLVAAFIVIHLLADRRSTKARGSGSLSVTAVGLVFGLGVWPVATALSGDALFHAARIRKLIVLGSLSLRRVDEFRDGGLHPGYAFPLWHGFLGMMCRLANVDPATLVRYAPVVLTALAFAVTYEAGREVFGSRGLGLAVLVTQVSLVALAPGHGGAFTSLALPATAARQLILPALLALFFERGGPLSRARWLPYAVVALAAAELALIHVTYVLFAAIVLVGFLLVRVLTRPASLRHEAGLVGAVLVAAGGVVAWLAPIASATRSHNPGCAEIRRAFVNYRGQLNHSSCSHYDLAPAMVTRSGAIAIAALVLLPLAAGAIRREWSALVLGGALSILVLLLPPWSFPHFADVVSISQARRAAGFVPVPFALVGGVALIARRNGRATLALALVAGITLEFEYPGWFTTAPIGAPGYPAWIALIGGAGALVAALLLRPSWREAKGLISLAAVVVFVAPTVIKGVTEWTPSGVAGPSPLSAGLLRELRQPTRRGAIVYSDPATSYQMAAYAPIYIAVAPPSHVANTAANNPYGRWNDALRFLKTGSLAIPRRYHACVIVLRRPTRLRLRLPVVYRDRSFLMLRLSRACP